MILLSIFVERLCRFCATGGRPQAVNSTFSCERYAYVARIASLAILNIKTSPQICLYMFTRTIHLSLNPSYQSYDLGFSFFSFHNADRPTPDTFTTLNRTPGISPLALPFRPKPESSTSSFSSTKFRHPSFGTVTTQKDQSLQAQPHNQSKVKTHRKR